MNKQESICNDPYVQAFPELAKFWKAANEGIFLLPCCKTCSKVHWHPRFMCPFCGSTDIQWMHATGRGIIYSYSIVRRLNSAPYVLAYIQVEDAAVLMSNVVDCDPSLVRIGAAVQVSFRTTEEGRHAPVFRLAES